MSALIKKMMLMIIYNECRPWPFNEFCRASEDKKKMFEPGVGKSWAMAWLQISG